jgi:translation initiation factor 2 beta subunit (eIF-2beta)/eIF-5
MLSKKSKLRYQKELEKLTQLCVNENQWVKDSERKTMSESEVNERETFTHW